MLRFERVFRAVRFCSARSFHFAPSLDQVSSLATDAKLLEKQKQQVMSKVFDTAINVTEYPLARRDDGISDDYHGTKVRFTSYFVFSDVFCFNFSSNCRCLN